MAVLTDEHGCEYRDDVTFRARISEHSNCICDGCHKGAKVIRISFANTFYRAPSYNKLEISYSEKWYCMDCLDKLIEAIKGAGTVV